MRAIKNLRVRGTWCLALVLLLALAAPVSAYPPGPYHLIYGTVRDQYGTPISLAGAQIIAQTPSGLRFTAPIIPGISSSPGVNYLLKLPLDSGSAPDLYQPNALLPAASYKMLVVIGTTTNLPIEMASGYLSLGLWAKDSRVDLTLGVDSNGDGIPDAWEYAFMAMVGTNLPLSSLSANTVLTPDGLTLRQQFILGSTLFDPANPLKLTFVGFNGTAPILQFPTVTGRSYTILASPDLRSWSPVNFNPTSEGLGATHAFYFASSIASIQVYVAPPPAGRTAQFYRILVQ